MREETYTADRLKSDIVSGLESIDAWVEQIKQDMLPDIHLFTHLELHEAHMYLEIIEDLIARAWAAQNSARDKDMCKPKNLQRFKHEDNE